MDLDRGRPQMLITHPVAVAPVHNSSDTGVKFSYICRPRVVCDSTEQDLDAVSGRYIKARRPRRSSRDASESFLGS